MKKIIKSSSCACYATDKCYPWMACWGADELHGGAVSAPPSHCAASPPQAPFCTTAPLHPQADAVIGIIRLITHEETFL